ncbi:hypothetical protein [Pseudomonas kuykendallii]|uniref:hypothetical protein n=1 Tax=Pseudomonas kuykendallii TaxID=1007099 RepID=UPI0028D5931A|nr:hypothetical protein [Pseudomonas kuykendallii]
MTKATQVTAALCERLAEISRGNGYLTDLQRVYDPFERVQDKAPLPYALVRYPLDSRTSNASYQATRVRTFEIECVFGKSAEPGALDDLHVDLLRCLGFGQDQPERVFPGLIEDQDEAEFVPASEGKNTHSLILTIGVTYVETYN